MSVCETWNHGSHFVTGRELSWYEKDCKVDRIFFFFLINLLIFGRTGSLLLCESFFWLQPARAMLRCGAQASYCGSFSCCTGCRCEGFSSCSSQALEHRPSSCGTLAELLWGMWNLPRPGLEFKSPALPGRLGKFFFFFFNYMFQPGRIWWEVVFNNLFTYRAELDLLAGCGLSLVAASGSYSLLVLRLLNVVDSLVAEHSL